MLAKSLLRLVWSIKRHHHSREEIEKHRQCHHWRVCLRILIEIVNNLVCLIHVLLSYCIPEFPVIKLLTYTYILLYKFRGNLPKSRWQGKNQLVKFARHPVQV